MNSTRRRTAASLTFIAFMAIILAIILLIGAPRNSGAMPPKQEAADSLTASQANSPADSTTTKSAAKKPSKKKSRKSTPRRLPPTTAPDNPDVLDSPVDQATTRRQ